MRAEIEQLLAMFQSGRLSRRQAVGGLAALCAGMAGSPAGVAAGSTFQATELNHIALRVDDIDRSVAFYRDTLGLRVTTRSPNSAFLEVGPHFLALFRRDGAGMDHYCYTIDDYDPGDAAERLRAAGIEPRRVAGRLYFDDPDGIEVQLSAPN